MLLRFGILAEGIHGGVSLGKELRRQLVEFIEVRRIEAGPCSPSVGGPGRSRGRFWIVSDSRKTKKTKTKNGLVIAKHSTNCSTNIPIHMLRILL